MGAGNSVMECALMGIQRTHKPKRTRRWRTILKQVESGTVPRLHSLIQLSVRFFAALLGLGLLTTWCFEAARRSFGDNCRQSAGDLLS